MTRLRIFALLAVLAALTTAFAACGGGGSDDPQQVLDDATFEGVESGSLDVSLAVKGQGEEGSDLDVTISGPFQSKEAEDLPELAIAATANGTARGKEIDFDGRLTLLSDRAYVRYDGIEYEVDPTTFGLAKQGFEQAQNQGSEGNAADVSACQEAAQGVALGDLAENLTSESDADVDGTSTTKVSGDLDTEAALDAIVELAEDPACSAQLESAGSVPLDELEEARDEVGSGVKKAQIEVWVGEDDIVRKVVADLTVEPKGTENEKVQIDLELTLSGVNEPQQISSPGTAKPIQGLFQKLGINPIELLESVSSGEGLGELLESLTENLPSTDSSSGGSGGAGGGTQKAYGECLKDAQTPADLQQCTGMIQ